MGKKKRWKIEYPELRVKVTFPQEISPEQLIDISKAEDVKLLPRNDGDFFMKGFLLPQRYDWVIIKDMYNMLVLVPLLKDGVGIE